MKKLTFFSHSNNIGGAEIVLFRIISYLSLNIEHQITLVTPKGPGKLQPIFKSLNINLVELSYDVKLPFDLDFPYDSNVSYFLQKTKPDLVIINTCTLPHVSKQCSELGIKYIYHNHGILTPSIIPALSIEMVNIIEAKQAIQATCTLVPSTFVKEYFDTFIGSHNVKVIANPILEINDLITQKITNNEVVISILASSDKNKGLEDAIRAIKLLSIPKAINVTLNFYTDGNQQYQQELQHFAKELGVIFNVHAKTTDVGSVYQHSHFVFVCSKVESFSNVVVEASAYGCVVCASRCGGPETLIEHGINGFLFNIGNSQELAEIVSSIILNPYQFEAVSKAAVANSKNYAIDIIGQQYAQIIEGELSA